MKKIITNGFLLFFLMVIVAFTLLFCFEKKEEFSEKENRYLQKIPTFTWENLLNGSYMHNWTLYLTDHFPFRDLFLSTKTTIEKWSGKTELNDVYLGKDGYLIATYPEPTQSDKIIEKVNQFCKEHPTKVMLVPTSISINQEKLPPFVDADRQLEELQYYQEQLDCDVVDLSFFQEQNKQTPLYYHLDHHWNSYGAYYGYQAYMKEQARPFTDFKKIVLTHDFRGTLDSKINDPSYPSDTMVLLDPNVKVEVHYVMSSRKTDSMFEPSYLDKKDKYSYFLDNNHPLITITNSQAEGELLIVKDSYANSFIPFLTSHFFKIHVIDPRFYSGSITDYLKEHPEIKETLFLYNMNTIDQDLGILKVR